MPEGNDKRGLLAGLDLFRKLRADELDRLVAFTQMDAAERRVPSCFVRAIPAPT